MMFVHPEKKYVEIEEKKMESLQRNKVQSLQGV